MQKWGVAQDPVLLGLYYYNIQGNDHIFCLALNLISSSVLGRGGCCKDVNDGRYVKDLHQGRGCAEVDFFQTEV